MEENDPFLLSLEIDSAFSGELSESQIDSIVEDKENSDSFFNSLDSQLFQNSSNFNSICDPEIQSMLRFYSANDSIETKTFQKTPSFFVDLHGFSRHPAKEIVLRSLINRPQNIDSTFVFVHGKGKHSNNSKFIMEDLVSNALSTFGVQGTSNEGRYIVTLPPPK